MHEFFMTKKYISVGVFSSMAIINSAQLIFKKGYKNFTKKPESKKLATELFSL